MPFLGNTKWTYTDKGVDTHILQENLMHHQSYRLRECEGSYEKFPAPLVTADILIWVFPPPRVIYQHTGFITEFRLERGFFKTESNLWQLKVVLAYFVERAQDACNTLPLAGSFLETFHMNSRLRYNYKQI